MNEDRDISNFEKLAAKTREQLIASKEKSMGWLHMAVDASADQLEKAGDSTTDRKLPTMMFTSRELIATMLSR